MNLPFAGRHLLFAFTALLCACKQAHPAMLPERLEGPTPVILEDFAIPMDAERVALTRAYFQAHNQSWFQQMPPENSAHALTFTPRIVVVHFTSIPTLAKVRAYFAPSRIASDRGTVTAAAALNVGSQFIVDRDGTIYRAYPETATSRHTIGLNHVAIGIENVGNADLGESGEGRLPLTEAQLAANRDLITYLAGRYPTINFLIGHMEYRELEAPDHPAHHLFVEDDPNYRTTKVDPGPQFMGALRRALATP